MSSTPTSTGMPRQIGPYRIEREIARGGMGIVYLAHDTRLDRAVAIKALPDDVAADPDRLARFEREAKTLASLNHPNIAGIYGVEESGGRRYLALEHIEGETLAARIARGPLPLAEALEICVQVAAGVEAAHESGVIHRDLKPGNVMITPGEHVKVLDFGLAKGKVAESESGSPRVGGAFPTSPTTIDSPTLSSPALPHSPTFHSPATMPGVILGTAAYLSPEQARGKAVDRRTDIWSFGCVLYECITGQRAFEGETVSDTIAKILVQDLDWSRLPKSTPPRIRELLKRCLEKDPRKRLRDIGEARLLLEGVRAGETGTAAAGAAPPPPTNPIVRAREAMRSHGFLFAAGLILGALLGLNMWGSLGSGARHGVQDVMRVSIPVPPELEAIYAELTPDGRTEILLAQPRPTQTGGESRLMLYVRRLDKTAFEPIRGTEGLMGFFISPDGRWISFTAPLSDRASQDRLFKVPVDGSAPPTPLMDRDETWFGRVIWLASGDMLVMRNGGAEFMRIPTNGAIGPQSRKIDAPGFKGTARFVTLALPGDRAAFVGTETYEGNAYHEGFGVLDLKTGRMKVLLRDGGFPRYVAGYLLFTKLDVLYAAPFDPRKFEFRGEPIAIMSGLRTVSIWINAAFNVSDNGILHTSSGWSLTPNRRGIVVDSKGSITEWSPDRQAFEARLSASRDGSRFASVLANPGNILYEIWVSERGRPASRRAVAVPGADVDAPVWSPDGARLAYGQQSRSAADGIYVVDVNGNSPPRQIAKTDSLMPTSWSPDGLQILCSGIGMAGLSGIFVTPASPPSGPMLKPKLVTMGPGHRGGGVFSPDGKWISYVSDETGKFEVYVCAWGPDGPLGESLPVSVGGGRRPLRWSPDGRKIYYVSSQDKVMSVSITTTPRLAASAPSVAWDLDALRVAGNLWDILPGGQLLAIQKAPSEDEITRFDLTVNFFEDLKQRFAAAKK